MTNEEKALFLKLSADRAENANTLEKPSMRGIKTSVVEKYSDQAHFIYELLQNADDAEAAYAKFILEKERLIFVHNGKRHFSVTDPETEEQDKESGTLGDINSITAVGLSNKSEASIGKFGVGFKAVFQYTSTPYIYDTNYIFKIDRFIVPVLLDNDFPGRNNEETVFVFPFNHPDHSAAESYSDIADKLKNLSYPLLFLTNLKSIEFSFEEYTGDYGKDIKEVCEYGDITAECVSLTHKKGTYSSVQDLWLFSRVNHQNRKYSVGFFTNEKGHLKPVIEPAFCFFPTKEITGLRFIIHAPFLLTDSREGIRAGVPHNDEMIDNLSALAADSLMILKNYRGKDGLRVIDDKIVHIIPIQRDIFSDREDKRKISFLPFYEHIKKCFETEEIIPAVDGYVCKKDAYWASILQISRLFSNEQLADLVNNENAHWVFKSIGRDAQKSNKSLIKYIDSIVRTYVEEEDILIGRTDKYVYNSLLGERHKVQAITGISADFIEKQSVEWLHTFYKWLAETDKRTKRVKDKPLLLDKNRKAAAAYDKNNHPILFLPADDIDSEGYRIVHPELLNNQDTATFLEKLGLQKPSFKDHIYNIILPKYQKGLVTVNDCRNHFLVFWKYFNECSREDGYDFLELLKGYECFLYRSQGSPELHRGKAKSIYFPEKEVVAFLEQKKCACFLALDVYEQLVEAGQEKKLRAFFRELGVREEIAVIKVPVDPSITKRDDLPEPRSTRQISYFENIIDGCKELVEYVATRKDSKKSQDLWNGLLRVIDKKCDVNNEKSLAKLLSGICRYYYRREQSEVFVSSDAQLLQTSAWLQTRIGAFVRPEDITRETLAPMYNTKTKAADVLLSFLKIPDKKENADNLSNLTEAQRKDLSLARLVKSYGIENEEDFEVLGEFMEYRAKKKKREASRAKTSQHQRSKAIEQAEAEFIDDLFDGVEAGGLGQVFRAATKGVLKDFVHRTGKRNQTAADELQQLEEKNDIDQDEYMPPAVDYNNRIEYAKRKSEVEIEKIVAYSELQERALSVRKYSYAWFNTLLEMECLSSAETGSSGKEVSITFSLVERVPGTKRTLVLKRPNRNIPQFLEDLADIPLVLETVHGRKTFAVEAASVQSYTLWVKLRNTQNMENFDITRDTRATIEAKSPAFLLDELRNRFAELDYHDAYDMQQSLCENIEFVFGPPGTGKTTYLAQKVLLPLMKTQSDCKVLVLTPTNKAADVLVRRLMDVCGDDHTYEKWLVRFGVTGDEEIEKQSVLKDKTFDIRSLRKSVTVTTIARFPYDFFMPQGARVFLNGIHWDYIVIDEASMIPLVNIVYPLYKKTPRKFIIAGDPFQIEPITAVDLWKNENIYTMVHLNSFSKPSTVPYNYKINFLTTQYRSVPAIGSVFSRFAYDGILKNYRSRESQKPIYLSDHQRLNTLTIIKYPVSNYESIYKPRRLRHSSSYHIYSALFTYEYVGYLAREIATNNPGEKVSIGIVAPYRAQADMISKLLDTGGLPQAISVQTGTIHGFQGDECDIIIAVFNTPPKISASKDMFLNKRNIINVSISRARDYLFMIMPNDYTTSIEKLTLVNRVETLMKEVGPCKELSTSLIEKTMFGDSHYLENNTFSTGHQSVNVYELPEKCYEIRIEDNAVDIQVFK